MTKELERQKQEVIKQRDKTQRSLDEAKRIEEVLDNTLKRYFSPEGRFIDVSQIKRICDSVDEIRDHLKGIDDKFDRLDNRYASKLTEKIVFGAVSLILVAFLSALIYLVIK